MKRSSLRREQLRVCTDTNPKCKGTDLKCTHTASRKVVYVELMGFWSRDAVWQRVELVKHLKTPFVFLVSERLRVSEKVLEPSANGALFVFKGVINRKRLLAQLDDLV